MSEILDLKNNIVAMASKLNGIVDMCTKSFAVTDKMNEILMLVHQVGLVNQNKNQDIFGCVLPDLVKRVSQLEDMILRKEKVMGKGDHVDFIVGTGKKKCKIHMFIREDDVTFYGKDKNLVVSFKEV